MSSSKAAALTEFHFFPRLPAEIRLQIWRLARPEALVLSYFNYFSSSVCQYKMAHGGTLQLRREAARVFGVCREAREEFVISNELKQDSRLQHQQPSFMYCKPYLGVGGVFVDWEVDILHVQCGDGAPMFDDQTARHVQRMVLSPEETIEDGGVLKVHYRLELVRLPSLHTVVLELPRSEVRDCRNVCEILKWDLDCETLLEPLNRQVLRRVENISKKCKNSRKVVSTKASSI